MMAPTIILEPDGTVTALGTGGSNRIRTAILQVAVNLLDHGMSLDDAVEAPRLHVETRRHSELRAGPAGSGASRRSRALGDKAHAWPAAQSVLRRRPCRAPASARADVEGAGDPRRQGVALIV